ncbi:anthranilate phosphoribosyltransferase [Candidatus Pacearchaeota archaeon]|nr:anthranilate phosphoribosyltransferase [Candidatus Pacearchaeota archaeon]
MSFSDVGSYCDLARKLLSFPLDLVKKTLEEVDPINPEVLEGFYRAYRQDWNLKVSGVDIVGTGGDGKNTFNISTTASFVCAASGIPIVKFGNRSATSSSGSMDVLSYLDIKRSKVRGEVIDNLEKANLAFIPANEVYPAFARFSSLRREIKKPTVFNYLGPLLNPVEVSLTVLGVSRLEAIRAYTDFFEKIKKRSIILTSEGFDEAIPFQESIVHSRYKERKILASKQGSLEELTIHTPSQSAEIILNILSKKDRSIRYDCVALNAGIAIAYFRNISIVEGIRLAEETIYSGKAYEVLRKLQGNN